MPEFISVPVPAHLVTAVMKLITERESGTEPEMMPPPAKSAPVRGNGESSESRNWTREQMEALHASGAPSVQLFCRVLSILADNSPNPIPIEELGKLTGIEGLTMQKKFGAVTRWMRNHLGDLRWPIMWLGGGWAMNAHNASIWKQVTA